MLRFHDGLPSWQQVYVRVLASGVGSVTTGFVLTPLQVLKVRWQMLSEAPLTSAVETSVGKRTLRSLAQRILAEEGILAFWRGVRTSFVMVAPSSALFMVSYEACKSILQSELPSGMVVLTPVLASSVGRIATGIVFAPLELIRTNQAAGRGRTIAETFRNVAVSSGVRGLYAGLSQTLYRDVPFSAIYWLCLENGKEHLRDTGWPIMLAPPLSPSNEDPDSPRHQSQPSSVAVFMAASGSGTLAAIATHPFDTIKTRLQVAATNTGGQVVTSLSVVRELGFAIFHRGLALRLMTIIPGTSIFLTTYAFAKRQMGESV